MSDAPDLSGFVRGAGMGMEWNAKTCSDYEKVIRVGSLCPLEQSNRFRMTLRLYVPIVYTWATWA